MEIKEYQERAMTTCMPSSNNFSYMMLNLVGELGELASKVAKAIRKEQISIEGNEFKINPGKMELEGFVDLEDELIKEAGDVLWQLAGLCSYMEWDLDKVARINLDKLASRQKRNVIDGNGDNR